MKKSALLVLSVVMAFTLIACSGHEAAPVRTIEEHPVPLESQTGDINHIDNISHSGSDDFTNTFTCNASDGDQLAVYITNQGENPVIVNITWEKSSNKEAYSAITVPANGGETFQTFAKEEGSGVDGTWTVNVTPERTSSMNITVTARQYPTQHSYSLDELNCTVFDAEGHELYDGPFQP